MTNSSTEVFQKYIRIATVQPDPDYYPAVEFLIEEAKTVGLSSQTIECLPGKPILILSWEGSDPSLSTIMLNSHMDVVPVFPEHWIHPPFSAHKMSQRKKLYIYTLGWFVGPPKKCITKKSLSYLN